MKMVKSLLLGSAAGLVAVAGAQAADLPVKAKPVEYVKVCSLYGAGFYYVPGTDMCLKVGGWVRSEWAFNYGNSMTTGAYSSTGGRQTRIDENFTEMRTRGYITADARQQTEWGTLRSYIAVGVNYDSPSGSVFNANRAFIQFAGFTFGTAQSFYDFYSAPAVAYLAAYPSSDTGDPGWKVAAYTAQLGNGFSATISAEEPRRSVVANGSIANSFLLGPLPTADQIGINWPDVVGALRVDQAWGSAQIMGAIHDASGGYYGTALAGSEVNGHPSDVIGFAIGAGIRLKTDFISKGDYFQAQFNYTEGALRYAAFTPGGAYSPFRFDGGNLGFGFLSDGVYSGATAATGTAVQLTTAWSVNASYEHLWNAQWRTSLYGGYLAVDYNATANAIICASNTGAGTIRLDNNCGDNSFGWWWIGSRTQWNITPNFYMGLDVIYQRLETATTANGLGVVAAQGAKPAATYVIDDQDNVSVRFRVHRDFLP